MGLNDFLVLCTDSYLKILTYNGKKHTLEHRLSKNPTFHFFSILDFCDRPDF